MDGVSKKYKSIILRGYPELKDFINKSNKERYDIVSFTQHENWYTVIYMDY